MNFNFYQQLDDDLIGRKPSAVTDKGAESKPKRSTSPVRTGECSHFFLLCRGYKLFVESTHITLVIGLYISDFCFLCDIP